VAHGRARGFQFYPASRGSSSSLSSHASGQSRFPLSIGRRRYSGVRRRRGTRETDRTEGKRVQGCDGRVDHQAVCRCSHGRPVARCRGEGALLHAGCGCSQGKEEQERSETQRRLGSNKSANEDGKSCSGCLYPLYLCTLALPNEERNVAAGKGWDKWSSRTRLPHSDLVTFSILPCTHALHTSSLSVSLDIAWLYPTILPQQFAYCRTAIRVLPWNATLNPIVGPEAAVDR